MRKELTKDEIKDIINEVLDEREQKKIKEEIDKQRLMAHALFKESLSSENTNSVSTVIAIGADYIDAHANEDEITRFRLARLFNIFNNLPYNYTSDIYVDVYNNKPTLVVEGHNNISEDEMIIVYNNKIITELIDKLELNNFKLIEVKNDLETDAIESTFRLKVDNTGIEEVKIRVTTNLDS